MCTVLCVLAPPDRYYNRTAYIGTTVKFPCATNLKELVLWRRFKTLQTDPTFIFIFGRMYRGVDPRITVDKNDSYTLMITNVTVDDIAFYRCAEDHDLGNKRYYGLTVAGDIHCEK